MRQYQLPIRLKSEQKALPVDLSKNETVAYFLGIMCGDGGVFDNAKWHTHQIILNTTSQEFASSFYQTLVAMGLHPYQFNIKRKKENPNWNPVIRVGASSWRLVNWYKSLSLPNIQSLLTSDQCITAFLRGIYESEGTWYRQCCFIANRSQELVNLVSYLLDKIAIPHRIYYSKRNNGTDIQIYINKTNSTRFLDLIKPCIKKP
jgi:hypothetical protein